MLAQQRVKSMIKSSTLSWLAQYLLADICLCFRCVWLGQRVVCVAIYESINSIVTYVILQRLR